MSTCSWYEYRAHIHQLFWIARIGCLYVHHVYGRHVCVSFVSGGTILILCIFLRAAWYPSWCHGIRCAALGARSHFTRWQRRGSFMQ